MKRTLLTLTLVLGILATSGWIQSQPRQQWEYKFEYKMNEKKANELGAQGWELIAIGAAGSGPASNVEEYVFKRAK